MNIIKQLRIKLGISQTELAKRSGVSRHYINRLERLGTRPLAPTAKRLSDVLGVDVMDICKK